MPFAYCADTLFTNEEVLNHKAVIIENDIITDIIDTNKLRLGINVIQHADVLAPSFIDIQIYGASSSLFSLYPNENTLHKMYEQCFENGTKYFLPTIATNSIDVFKNGIDAIHNYWKNNGKGVPGLHVEGPWINKIKRGAHIASFIHSPTIAEVKDLLEYSNGAVKIITLAPEVCSKEVINLIESYGVIISAGHSNATYAEAQNFFEQIHYATHLFNAMSPLQHREPGLPASIMLHNKAMCSIVADGYHVDFTMISLAKKLMKERLFLITDAVTETNGGPYPHKLNGEKYESNGILSGSALTMIKAVKNCIEKCGIPADEAVRMASLYPAQVLSIANETGKIKIGYKADLVLMNNNFDVIKCV